jgi:HK97 family phage prohead protease
MPIAPKQAQENAKRGLELREKWERGGTAVGVARARDLSNGADLSLRTISRMASFNRHRQNYQPDKRENDGGPTAGTIAWLLWGGTAGIDWAINFNNNKNTEMQKQFQTFDCKLEIKANETEDEQYFKISGYGSTFGNTDLVNDVVEKGAFKKTLKKRMPKLLLQHNMRDVPIGIIDSIKEDENGLLFEARLPKDDALVRDRIMPQIKIGSLNTFSIGYSVDLAETAKSGVRQLKEVSLYEISLVTFPANEKATMQSFKNEEMKQDFIDSIDSIRTLEKAIATQFSNQDAKMLVAKAKEIMQRDVATPTQRDAETMLELSMKTALLKIETIK